MQYDVIACLLFLSIAAVFQGLSIFLAYGLCSRTRPEAWDRAEHVTIVRPVCGLEPYSERTLGSSFGLNWKACEVIFCARDADDPVIPVIERLIREHPHVDARLLIGDTPGFVNPKLANMAKGWRVARHDWIVFVDSNVLLPSDYLEKMLAAWDNDTGLVTAPPAGASPDGYWAEVECAFLNAWQARVQYAAARIGFGFAQGKNLMFRKEVLSNGGFEALAAEPAEDAAATKLIRSRGEHVRLAAPPFPQLLGPRTFRQVWKRQLRWARLRRSTFPFCYAPEILCGAVPPAAAFAYIAIQSGWPALPLTIAFLGLWYLPELLLERAAGWPNGKWQPLVLLTRDLMMPAIYVASLFGRDVVWNDNKIPIRNAGRNAASQAG